MGIGYVCSCNMYIMNMLFHTLDLDGISLISLSRRNLVANDSYFPTGWSISTVSFIAKERFVASFRRFVVPFFIGCPLMDDYPRSQNVKHVSTCIIISIVELSKNIHNSHYQLLNIHIIFKIFQTYLIGYPPLIIQEHSVPQGR